MVNKIKVLNLYAGIGGNRKLWNGVDVTAVEINQNIAAVYKKLFPKDNVIVDDAHKYLLEHYNDGWDFIWSSPPCPTHSTFKVIWVKSGKQKPVYPDMKLYQEVIFLKKYFDGKHCIENVIPYYKPLIKPQKCDRHYFWCNFPIEDKKYGMMDIRYGKAEVLENKYDIDLREHTGIDKRQVLRNCVRPELGKHIFDCAFKKKQLSLNELNQEAK